jgi:hypothetical protein
MAIREVKTMDSELIERLQQFEGSDDLGNGNFAVCFEAAAAGIADNARIAELEAEVARLRGALGELLALGPDHDSWCGIGPIYNCTCDLHPARQAARAALTGDKP